MYTDIHVFCIPADRLPLAEAHFLADPLIELDHLTVVALEQL